MKCEKCGDVGYLEKYNAVGIPYNVRCVCKKEEDRKALFEKTWRGLSLVQEAQENVLEPFLNENLWVTATYSTFRSHLKTFLNHVFDQKKTVRVTSDAHLISAWLATVLLKGGDIFDQDASSMQVEHWTLSDLVVPPELLIIELGVKVSKNEAMPDVLLESLELRRHYGKTTWLLDQPDTPLNFAHRCYSDALLCVIDDWAKLSLFQGERKPPQAFPLLEDKKPMIQLARGEKPLTPIPTSKKKMINLSKANK